MVAVFVATTESDRSLCSSGVGNRLYAMMSSAVSVIGGKNSAPNG